MNIQVPISPGELLDKISILQIKQHRIDSSEALQNVNYELNLLSSLRCELEENWSDSLRNRITDLEHALEAVNQDLWSIEERIRYHESRSDFGEGFVSLARSVYQKNDHRAGIKRQINELLNSRIVEEKSYVATSNA